jgi:hypothetical protein
MLMEHYSICDDSSQIASRSDSNSAKSEDKLGGFGGQTALGWKQCGCYRKSSVKDVRVLTWASVQ